MQDLAALSWTWIVLAGTIVLGAVLAYVMVRSSRLSRAQSRAAERGARVAYREEDRNPPHEDAGENSPRTRLDRRTVIVTVLLIAAIVLAFLVYAFWEGGPAVTQNTQGSGETPPVAAPDDQNPLDQ